MEPDLINSLVAIFANQAANAIDALVPSGSAMAYSITTLGIIFFCVSMISGGGLAAPIFNLCLWSAGTAYVIANWSAIVRGTLAGCHEALGLILGTTYHGPSQLLTLAADTAARVMSAGVSLDWTSPLASTGALISGIFVGPLVYLGLAAPGLIAAGSELTLVVGAIAAPIILPLMAWEVTRPMGWGAIRFLLDSAVRVITVGAVAAISASSVTQVLALGGADHALTSAQMFQLLGCAALVSVLGFSAAGLSSALVGGGLAVGLGAFQRVAGGVVSGVSMGGSAMGGGSAAASSSAGMARGGGRVGSSSSSGSAFPR